MCLVSSTAGGVTNAYQYDILNNRTAVLTTDAQGATTSVYAIFDAANQKTELRSGSATGTLVTAMAYDLLGRTAQITRTGQPTQSYDYDKGFGKLSPNGLNKSAFP